MRLIDADDLIDLLDDEFRHDRAFTAMNLYSIVNSATTIEARPTGKWIVVEKMLNIWACSNCKEEYCSETGGTPSEWDYNYCPKCGARMEAENDSSK